MTPPRTQTSINVLLVKIGTEPGLEDIPLTLRQLDPRIKTFGVLNKPGQMHRFDVVVSSSYESMLGAHADYLERGLYVRPELFQKLCHNEGQILRMYDRVAIQDLSEVAALSSPIPRFKDTIDDRSQLFLRQVAFWDFALREHQIDAVVAQNYGHNGFDAVLQAVAVASDLPYMFFHEFRPFLRSLQIYESVKGLDSDSPSSDVIKDAKDHFPFVPDSPGRVTLMRQQIGLEESAKPSVSAMYPSKKQPLLFRMSRLLMSRDRLIRTLRRRSRNRKSMSDERRAQSTKGVPQKFLFCELQSQPNGTTALKGSMFADQRESLAMIANHLPTGWALVVKESDRQWTRMYPRRRNFWTHIAAVPRIHVMASTADAGQLLEQSSGLVETSYSTLALQAVQRGLPVIVLGHTHIGELAGVFNVQSDADAAEAVRTICAYRGERLDPARTKESLESFLKKKLVSTIEGALSYAPKLDTKEELQAFQRRTVMNVSAVIVAWLHRKLLTLTTP
jgi:hypothetical protein